MFGQNPIRDVENDPTSLAVQEIFFTIQGEGPYAGTPAVFIRLAGCNLACTFCDTEFESGLNNRMTPEQIVAEVLRVAYKTNGRGKIGHQLVVLTGGEPLRQSCAPLIQSLLNAGTHVVQIETAGTLWDEALSGFYLRGELDMVCSPKTPMINGEIARLCRHFKYIISAGETSAQDGLPIKGTQTRNAHLYQTLYRPWSSLGWDEEGTNIWVGPCDLKDEVKNRANMAEAARVAMEYGYRLTLQMHKVVGLP